MKTCWNCRTRNLNDEVFCKQCGQNIAEVVIEPDPELSSKTYVSEEPSSGSSGLAQVFVYFYFLSAIPTLVFYLVKARSENDGNFFFIASVTNWLWAAALFALFYIFRKESIFYYLFAGLFERIKLPFEKFMDWAPGWFIIVALMVYYIPSILIAYEISIELFPD